MAEKLELDLIIDAAGSAQTVGEVRQSLKDINEALQKTEIGSEAFNKLKLAAGKLKADMKDLKTEIKLLDPGESFNVVAKSLGGVAAGFQGATAAAALFGSESEDLQKALLKVQAAMALSQAIQQVGEMGKAFKLLGTIIAANPLFAIGAALIAIGAIITANILKWREENSEVGKLEKKITEVKKVNETLNTLYDSQIAVLQAQGGQEEKIFELQRKKILSKIQEVELQIKLNQLKAAEAGEISFLDSLIEGFTFSGVAANRAKGRVKEFADANKALNVELKVLKDQLEIVNINEEKFNQKSAQGYIDALNKRRATMGQYIDFHKISSDQFKAHIDEITKSGLDFFLNYLKQQTPAIEEQSKIIASTLTELPGQMQSSYEEERPRRLAFLINELKQDLEIRKEFVAQNISLASSLTNSLSAISEARLANDLAAAGDNAAKREQIEREHFERSKKIQIAQTIIGALQGVVNILSQKSILPAPFAQIAKIGEAALLTITTAANIAKIRATQFNSSVGGGVSSGAAGSGVNINNVATGSTLLNPDGSVVQPPNPNDQRVYVVETDITSTQRKVNVIENRAKIG